MFTQKFHASSLPGTTLTVFGGGGGGGRWVVSKATLVFSLVRTEIALYMVNDPVPLSDPYLGDVLNLICNAGYKLGTFEMH